MQGNAPRPTTAVFLAFLATVVLLGSNFVAVRFSNRELPPFWGAALRFLLAAGLLVAFSAARRLQWPRGRAFGGAVGFGALAFFGNFGLLYWALQWVPAGVASVAFATIPLTTFVVAVAIGLERFRWAGLLGAAVVLAGVAAVSWTSLQTDIPGMALAAVFGASLCAALSGIVVKRFGGGHPIAFNAVAMAVGAAGLLAISAAYGESHALPEQQATWLALGWLVMSAVTAFTLMVWVIAHWTASANAYGAVLQPLVTVPLAAWLAGEGVSGAFLAGALLIIWGVYIGVLHRPRPAPAPQAQTP